MLTAVLINIWLLVITNHHYAASALDAAPHNTVTTNPGLTAPPTSSATAFPKQHCGHQPWMLCAQQHRGQHHWLSVLPALNTVTTSSGRTAVLPDSPAAWPPPQWQAQGIDLHRHRHRQGACVRHDTWYRCEARHMVSLRGTAHGIGVRHGTWFLSLGHITHDL